MHEQDQQRIPELSAAVAKHIFYRYLYPSVPDSPLPGVVPRIVLYFLAEENQDSAKIGAMKAESREVPPCPQNNNPDFSDVKIACALPAEPPLRQDYTDDEVNIV